jgi:hypothetical protein
LERNIKIRLIKLKDVSSYIHLSDIKSIENWCQFNCLDIHIQNRRKYVYEHELLEALERRYVDDTMKNHPEDFIERCTGYVSHSTLMKFSGYTSNNITVTSNPYGFLPIEVQDLLKTL